MNEVRNQSVDVELLARAFRNLPGLKNVWTTDSFPNNCTVWGLRKIVDDLGTSPFYASMGNWVPLKQDSYDSQFKVERELKAIGTHSVAVVLEAIHRSGINFSGGGLHFTAVPQNMEFAETTCSRKLSPSATPPKTFAMSRIAEMKYLSRVKELNMRTFYPAPRRQITDPKDARKLKWLHQTVANMTGLEALALLGENTESAEIKDGILGDEGYPFTLTLPKLKVLWIEHMILSTSTLLDFLKLHRETLQRFYLNNIILRDTIRMYVQSISVLWCQTDMCYGSENPDDRTNWMLVPWLERNNWRVSGYCSADAKLLGYAWLELREGFRDVCGTRDLLE
jgi:hypothetical protein